MTAVGFEPTPIAGPAPEAGALDHSAKQSLDGCKALMFLFRTQNMLFS